MSESRDITPAAAAPARARGRSRYEWLERYVRHPGLMTGIVILTLLLIVAIAAPLLAPYSPTQTDLGNTLAHPSWNHWLGTASP